MEKSRKAANASLALAAAPKKKTSGKIILTLILVLLVVGLLAGVTVCYLFDYLSLRTGIVSFFINQDEQYRTRLAELDQREVDLSQREAALDETAAKQEQTDKKQQREQERLETFKAELDTKEKDLNTRITAFDNGVAEYDKVVQTVAAMDAKSAAAMLETLWPVEDTAKLLNAMIPKKAAAILEKMTTAGAKTITEKMILLSQ
ncbi:MAG: hypothetical protein EOM66_01255 [Clostridia bacterium]|nr:hypothetical protein [Clostridia bacterium]